jgi:hypothetical protein
MADVAQTSAEPGTLRQRHVPGSPLHDDAGSPRAADGFNDEKSKVKKTYGRTPDGTGKPRYLGNPTRVICFFLLTMSPPSIHRAHDP